MKPRLGDDEEDGWLLLGSQGAARANGQALTLSGGGSSLSAHEVLSAASAGAVFGSAAPGSAGVGGGSRTRPIPILQR